MYGPRPGPQAASRLVLQDERDLQQHPVFRDLPLLDHDLLTLDPRSGEVAKRLLGSGNALLNSVLEALRGSGLDFGDFGDGHRGLQAGRGGHAVVGWYSSRLQPTPKPAMTL